MENRLLGRHQNRWRTKHGVCSCCALVFGDQCPRPRWAVPSTWISWLGMPSQHQRYRSRTPCPSKKCPHRRIRSSAVRNSSPIDSISVRDTLLKIVRIRSRLDLFLTKQSYQFVDSTLAKIQRGL